MHDDEEERDEDTRSHEEVDPTTPRLAYNSYLPCRLDTDFSSYTYASQHPFDTYKTTGFENTGLHRRLWQVYPGYLERITAALEPSDEYAYPLLEELRLFLSLEKMEILFDRTTC